MYRPESDAATPVEGGAEYEADGGLAPQQGAPNSNVIHPAYVSIRRTAPAHVSHILWSAERDHERWSGFRYGVCISAWGSQMVRCHGQNPSGVRQRARSGRKYYYAVCARIQKSTYSM